MLRSRRPAEPGVSEGGDGTGRGGGVDQGRDSGGRWTESSSGKSGASLNGSGKSWAGQKWEILGESEVGNPGGSEVGNPGGQK